jgi:hypothetical protein
MTSEGQQQAGMPGVEEGQQVEGGPGDEAGGGALISAQATGGSKLHLVFHVSQLRKGMTPEVVINPSSVKG